VLTSDTVQATKCIDDPADFRHVTDVVACGASVTAIMTSVSG